MLKKAPTVYESNVEYAANPIARSLRDVARVHLADLGTRVFYVSHGGYDTHANEIRDHDRLLMELSSAVMDFQQDLRDHDALDNVLLLVFTEFGRRVKDNSTGTDHGAGGGSFLIGRASTAAYTLSIRHSTPGAGWTVKTFNTLLTSEVCTRPC